jgi:hypothetical protein
LKAESAGSGVTLTWELHGKDVTKVAVERRTGNTGKWERIASIGVETRFTDPAKPAEPSISYRVRAINGAGESAYSNVVRVMRK